MAATVSLNGVGQGGTYTGAALTTGSYSNAVMVVTSSGWTVGGAGASVVTVVLEGTIDGTTWVVLGTVNIGGGGSNWVAAGLPTMTAARAVITGWGIGVTAGTVTATINAA